MPEFRDGYRRRVVVKENEAHVWLGAFSADYRVVSTAFTPSKARKIAAAIVDCCDEIEKDNNKE